MGVDQAGNTKSVKRDIYYTIAQNHSRVCKKVESVVHILSACESSQKEYRSRDNKIALNLLCQKYGYEVLGANWKR